MGTVGLAIRKNIIDQIEEKISNSKAYFFVGFNKVDSSALSELRNKLRLNESYVFVAKNSLIRKAFHDCRTIAQLESYLKGETGIVFGCGEDIVKPCKIIVEFAKENENFSIKGGVTSGKEMSGEELEFLAKLPERNVLLGQAVASLLSPLSGFLACLNQMLLKFVWVADEIKKAKEAGKEKVTEKREEEGQPEKDKKEKKPEKEEGQEKHSDTAGKDKAEEKAEEKEGRLEKDKKEKKPEKEENQEEQVEKDKEEKNPDEAEKKNSTD